MDRALVERMVGAVVLVLLLVLFAPALLDGTSDRPMTLPVPASDRSDLKRTAVILLNEPAGPSIIPPQTSAPATELAEPTEVAAVVREPEQISRNPTPAVVPPVAEQPQSASPPTGFAVQVGSFGSRDNANQYAGEIQALGYNVFVIRSSGGKNPIYRVYSGTESTRADAEKLSARLSASGYSVMVVHLGDSNDR